MNDNAEQRAEFVKQVRAYQQKVAGWFQQSLGFWRRDDDYTQSSEYQVALENYQKFNQQNSIDYSPVIEYARNLYERYEASDKGLDEKADSIIRYLGGGTALVTFGALLSIKAESRDTRVVGLCALVSLLPALICAVVAVYSAIRARMRRSAAVLPAVEWARRMAEHYRTKQEIELNVYLMFSPICEAAHYRNIMKARWVTLAHHSYCLCLACLAVPVIVVSACLAFLH